MIASIYTAWTICLVVAAVVVILAAALLIAIIVVARSILSHGAQALAAAEQIARDTSVIWALDDTNRVAGEIVETVEQIEAHGGAIVAALHEPSALGGLRR